MQIVAVRTRVRSANAWILWLQVDQKNSESAVCHNRSPILHLRIVDDLATKLARSVLSGENTFAMSSLVVGHVARVEGRRTQCRRIILICTLT